MPTNRRFAGKRTFYERGLSSSQERGGLQDPLLPVTAGYLGGLHERQGEWEEALRYYLLDLEARELQHQPGDPRIGWAHNAVGHAQVSTGKLEDGRGHLMHALEILESAWGSEDPRVATILLGLASVEWKVGNFENCRRSHVRALAILQKAHGVENPDVARLTYNLACIDARRGDRDGAMASLRKALEGGFRWTGARTDDDLESLRGDPEFEAVIAQMSHRE